MRFLQSLIAGAALAFSLVAAPALAGEEEDMVAAAKAAYAPYSSGEYLEGAVWNRPIYSAELSGLIAEWEAGLSTEEVEDLNSFDWLCECQDYDPQNFRAEFESDLDPETQIGIVIVTYDLGFGGGETKTSALLFSQEDGRWVIDDIYSDSAFPSTLQSALRWAITAHQDARGDTFWDRP